MQRSFLPGLAALAMIVGAAPAAAGDSHDARVRALSAPDCAWSGGALADPERTQRCLAERFKAAKQPKPATNTAAPPTEGTH